MRRAVTVRCEGEDATERCAARLAALASPGGLVVLTGGLGAGKTTFVRAYAHALGVDRARHLAQPSNSAPLRAPWFNCVAGEVTGAVTPSACA